MMMASRCGETVRMWRESGSQHQSMAAFLKKRYGAPAEETRANLQARGPLYKVEWKKGDERALLTSQSEKRRASLTVWRGDFEDEIYRVR